MKKSKLITFAVDFTIALLNLGVGIYLFLNGSIAWIPLLNFFAAGWAMAFGVVALMGNSVSKP